MVVRASCCRARSRRCCMGRCAGVVLDRLDRKTIMIISDLVRAVVALGFILHVDGRDHVAALRLSAMLMFASPFFTSGRSAILPSIASKEELHTANSLTQTTQWTTLTLGTFLGRARRDRSSGTSGRSSSTRCRFCSRRGAFRRLHVPAAASERTGSLK